MIRLLTWYSACGIRGPCGFLPGHSPRLEESPGVIEILVQHGAIHVIMS